MSRNFVYRIRQVHLKLLAEVPDVSKANALNFRTAKDLYDKFWDYKKDVIHARIGDSEHWTDVIYTLCDYMSKQKPCGRSISWLFHKLAELPWTQEALDIVIWYGLNDHNPQSESQLSNKSHDIHFKGINSTRGSAVSAIAKLIFADKNRAAYFQIPLEQIVKDSSTAVRSCAAEALTAFLNYDRNLAVILFQQLCETEEVLLANKTVEYFLYYAIPT